MPNYRRAARRAARRRGIDPDLFERQIGAESGFNPNARSPAGARGIAQFMPETARGMGVNLNDGRARDDLDGAARLMANYVKKYGSYAKALEAYNAGPGGVGKGYAETRAYVAKIMRGRRDQTRVDRGSSGGRSAPRSETTTRTTPGVDRSADRQALLQGYLRERGRPGALLDLKRGLDSAQDTPSRTTTTTRKAKRSTRTARQSSGQTDIEQIIRMAERRGLKVGEHPKRGGVAPVHAQGSFHGRRSRSGSPGSAVDITGSPKALARFQREMDRRFGRDLEESIYNGPGGGRNRKNGRRVGRGFYSGHRTHYHAADDD